MNINNDGLEIIIIKNDKGGFLPHKKRINGDFCALACSDPIDEGASVFAY